MTSTSLFDWTLYGQSFSSSDMRSVFDEAAAVRRWVDVERVAARVQGRLGIIPARSGAAIDEHLDAAAIDLDVLREDTVEVGRPIVGLVRQLTTQVPTPHDAWVHYGITTYDVMDTASVLQVRDGVSLLRERCISLRTRWETLAAAHRDTVMIGRTNGQHAQPTTFGARIAGWLEEFVRHQSRLDQAAQRAVVIQLGSMVGSLASVHPNGLALRDAMAAELGLGVPATNWHNNRDGLTELVQQLGLLCASIARIARDIASLSSTDVAEVSERGAAGRGRSSGMPHKRNPRAAEFAEALGHLGRLRSQEMSAVMGQEHERSGGTWIAEWMILPEVFLLSSAAVAWLIDLFSRLEVDANRMRENVDVTLGMAMSERLTLFLAGRTDKASARALMDRACAMVRTHRRPLSEVMAGMSEVLELVSLEELDPQFDPESYLGHAPEMVDAAIAASKRAR